MTRSENADTATAERPVQQKVGRGEVIVDVALVAAAALDGVLNLYSTSGFELILTVIAAAGLLLRRRFPAVSVVLALPALFVTGGPIASVIALYTVARTSTTAVVVVASATTFLGLALSWHDFATVSDVLLALVYATMTSAGAVALGRLRRIHLRLSASLVDLRRSRDEETRLAAREAVADERAHLAREMHDVVSHQVSLISVQAGALMVRVDDPEVIETADTIRVLAATTLTELRQMLLVLRAEEPEPAPLSPQPTLAQLSGLLDAADLDVEASTDLPPSLTPAVQRAIYRAVQEGLTNVRKHAPGTRVQVTARIVEGATVELRVRNTAPPGPPRKAAASARLGHVGLSERAHLLGGTFRAGSTGDGGYEIVLRLPLTPPVGSAR